jgi:hypothetical protein
VSIWASIPGDDPLIYEGGRADYIEPNGWMDVASSAAGDSARIIIRDSRSEARIALDADGLAELHRRVVLARIDMMRRSMWKGR